MFADPSRIADLVHLQKALRDPTVPEDDKQRAYRSQQKILKEMNDPKLCAMRERLVRLVEAGDRKEIWKQSMRIKEYLGEERLEEGTMA